jgi:hypothetical protein
MNENKKLFLLTKVLILALLRMNTMCIVEGNTNTILCEQWLSSFFVSYIYNFMTIQFFTRYYGPIV